MPIVKVNGSTQIEFGNGDVEVSPGLLDQSEIVGALCFSDRQPSEIGTRTNYSPSKLLDLAETPVRMTFEKVESIDVIIRMLQKTKRMMLVKIGVRSSRETLRSYGFADNVLRHLTDQECDEQLEAIEIYPEG